MVVFFSLSLVMDANYVCNFGSYFVNKTATICVMPPLNMFKNLFTVNLFPLNRATCCLLNTVRCIVLFGMAL